MSTSPNSQEEPNPIDLDFDLSSNKLRSCSPDELVIRTNFKKDYKLSCPVLDDNDCFNKSLAIWNLQDDWKYYLRASQKYPNFDEFRQNLRHTIVNRIKSLPAFNKMSVKPTGAPKATGPRTYLQPYSVGRRLLSIDLVKGNYQAVKMMNPDLVFKSQDYEEFMRLFTEEEALTRSKMFRQLIFGLLNPELQKAQQTEMMNHIVDQVQTNATKSFPIVHLTSDEIVYVIESDADRIQIQSALANIPYDFRITEFKINLIKNDYGDGWYVRYDQPNPSPRLMAVHVRYVNQVYNFIQNPTTPNNQTKDFWWRERGRLCQLMEPEKLELVTEPTPLPQSL